MWFTTKLSRMKHLSPKISVFLSSQVGRYAIGISQNGELLVCDGLPAVGFVSHQCGMFDVKKYASLKVALLTTVPSDHLSRSDAHHDTKTVVLNDS